MRWPVFSTPVVISGATDTIDISYLGKVYLLLGSKISPKITLTRKYYATTPETGLRVTFLTK